MAADANRAPAETPDGAPPWRLTPALNGKLAELRAQGYRVLWIESSREDLTRLVDEGGDHAVELDDDPKVDRAWFGDVEIRLSPDKSLTWIFLEGEIEGEVSVHLVGPPGPARADDPDRPDPPASGELNGPFANPWEA